MKVFSIIASRIFGYSILVTCHGRKVCHLVVAVMVGDWRVGAVAARSEEFSYIIGGLDLVSWMAFV
jgi:hypothetical protein